MANEVQKRYSLIIKKGALDYQSRPVATQADQLGVGGPTPGAILVSTDATVVDLSQLTTPGECWMQNQDQTNWVEYGLHDGYLFYPLGQILPGDVQPLRLSPNLFVKEQSTGTGTTGKVMDFALRAHVASCIVTIDAFEA